MAHNKGLGMAGIILALAVPIIFILVCREKLVLLAGYFCRGIMGIQ